MKTFLLKILLFIVLAVLIDRVFIVFKEKNNNLFSKVSIEKMKALSNYINKHPNEEVDLGILGSSHVQFGINPDAIENKTSFKTLNFGFGFGTNLGLQFTLIKRLKTIYPELDNIILGIDVFSFNREAIFKHETLDKLLGVTSDGKPQNLEMKLLLYSNAFRYARNIPGYLKGVIKKGEWKLPYFRKGNKLNLEALSVYNGYSITPKGWVQGDGLLNKDYIRYKDFTFSPTNSSIEAINSIIAYCDSTNIRFMIMHLPEHEVALSYSKKYKDFETWIKQFSLDNDVIYLDFNKPEHFAVENDSLFFDSDHLNKKGAKIFTDILSEDLMDALN